MSAAHGDSAGVLDALDSAAREGVIEADESSLRFAHPLLASICYEQAQPWKRRAVHRALAETVVDVEERARHMALSVAGPDAVAASHLDAAADQAAGRGATSAAAELNVNRAASAANPVMAVVFTSSSSPRICRGRAVPFRIFGRKFIEAN